MKLLTDFAKLLMTYNKRVSIDRYWTVATIEGLTKNDTCCLSKYRISFKYEELYDSFYEEHQHQNYNHMAILDHIGY